MIDLEFQIKKLNLTPETVALVISSQAEEDNFWEFSAALSAAIKDLTNQGKVSTELMILFLGKGVSIRCLDEEDMEFHGWRRIEKEKEQEIDA